MHRIEWPNTPSLRKGSPDQAPGYGSDSVVKLDDGDCRVVPKTIDPGFNLWAEGAG